MAIYSLDFTSDKFNDVAPAVVSFTALYSSDLPLTFLWDFEDGETSTDENPVHTFIRGTYKITLTVTDGFDTMSVEKYNYIDSYTSDTIDIDTVEKLQAIGSPGNKISGIPGYSLRNNYLQTANIDASATIGWNGGLGFLPIPKVPPGSYDPVNTFSGVYDGDGYLITDLVIDRSSLMSDTYGAAIFGWASDCSIVNVILIGVNITLIPGAGGSLIGTTFGPIVIDNCYVSGNIQGSGNAGGLAGDVSYDKQITNCIIENMTIDGGGLLGGCVGYCNNGGYISDCHVVRTTISGVDGQLGGICGSVYLGNISNCSFSGEINTADCWNVGGIVGSYTDPDGIMDNCQADGTINFYTGVFNNWLGGLIGYGGCNGLTNSHATMTFVNAAGDTYCSYIGGLAGDLGGNGVNPLIKNCYSTSDITGVYSIGGLFGRASMFSIEDCYSTGNLYASSLIDESSSFGGIGGWLNGVPVMRNCYSTGIINGGSEGVYTGGLAGYFSATLVEDCYHIGDVYGPGNLIGGLFGSAGIYDTVRNCYSVGNVTIKGGSGYSVGGSFGRIYGGVSPANIIDCFSVGDVTDSVTGSTYITAGFIGGSFYIQVNRCYSIGNVIGYGVYAAGFIGFTTSSDSVSIITECFSIGSVSNTNGGICGGFIGESHAIISNCFCRGDITFIPVNADMNYVGGFCGMHEMNYRITNCYSSGLITVS